MSIFLFLGCFILALILAVVLIAKNRGTDIRGLITDDISKYTSTIDKIK